MRYVPVQDVVLYHEQDVKEYGEQSQAELGRITEQRVPIIVIVCVQDHLQHTQHSTCKVQQNVADTPSRCTLSPVVHQGLQMNS